MIRTTLYGMGMKAQNDANAISKAGQPGWGAAEVQCITSPGNSDSIASHTRIAFTVISGAGFAAGVSVHQDYDGPRSGSVVFTRSIV